MSFFNTLGYATDPYLICLSDYNRLLELSGKPVIKLSEDEAAVYIGSDFTTVNRTAMLNGILTEHPETELVGSPIHLTGEVQSVNLVADRSITLSFALILPDEAFLYHTQGMYDTYVNAVLNMKAIFRIWAASFFLHRSIHLYYPLSGDCVSWWLPTPLWVFSS